ncbi:MAG: hypothetical protein RLZ83_242, partial [Pseudomonadota bacterium]|jgi:hypothetical protein
LASHVTVNVDSPQPQRAEQFLEARRVPDVSVATEAGRSVIDASGPLTAAVLQSLPSQPSPGLEAVPAPPAGGQMPLRTTTLGPAVDLLVGEEPEPDLAALLSYARDSGLGAQALKKLFGGEVPATASLASAATSASAALASPVTSLPAGPVAALPASPGPQAGDPAVMSMAVWIGGRAGASTAGGRSLNVVAPPVRPVAFLSERVDAASAPLIRAGGFEPTSSGTAAASPASALPTSAAPPVAVSPSMVTVPGVAAPVSHADLALRLARATATRMVAELRQGNGSLRLQIEPASLGKVDIDMTLRQGALEATLVAHQSVTRELLADGLPRLRDTLMQLGMNVAGVEIKSGFNGQGDGKSTNQQNKEIWYSSRRGTAVESTSPMDGGDQRRSSRLDLWA